MLSTLKEMNYLPDQIAKITVCASVEESIVMLQRVINLKCSQTVTRQELITNVVTRVIAVSLDIDNIVIYLLLIQFNLLKVFN